MVVPPAESSGAAPTVEIVHQFRGDGRGTFALFHFVWAQLHCTDARFVKRVSILDGDQDFWGQLFEPPDTELSPSGEEIQVPLLGFRDYSPQLDGVIDEEIDQSFIVHRVFLGYPTGREFQATLEDVELRRRMATAVEANCRPRRWVRVDAERSRAHMGHEFVIGLHLRSTYHLGAEMTAERYIHDVVVPEVLRIVEERGVDDYAVFVATIVGDYLRECEVAFGDRLFHRDVALVDDPSLDFFSLDATAFEKARDVLVDSLVLAGCDFVLGVPSNVLIATLIFNPELPFKTFDHFADADEAPAFC